jgi:hypothetical protein
MEKLAEVLRCDEGRRSNNKQQRPPPPPPPLSLTVPRRLRRRPDDLRPQRLEDVDLFVAHLLRQADDAPVALDRRRERDADAGVAARRLDQGVAGLDAAALLGVLDHALADAVLHGTAGVVVLALGEEVAREAVLLLELVAPGEER